MICIHAHAVAAYIVAKMEIPPIQLHELHPTLPAEPDITLLQGMQQTSLSLHSTIIKRFTNGFSILTGLVHSQESPEMACEKMKACQPSLDKMLSIFARNDQHMPLAAINVNLPHNTKLTPQRRMSGKVHVAKLKSIRKVNSQPRITMRKPSRADARSIKQLIAT